jgi:hypothetical protein
LYQVGFLDGKGNVMTDPVWKEIGVEAPLIAEVYKTIYGKQPSGPAWEAEKALIGGYSLTRLMAFSPKMPAARIAELRQTFQTLGRDPVFLAEWEKSQGAAPRLVQGDEAVNIAASILRAPREAVNILKKLATP